MVDIAPNLDQIILALGIDNSYESNAHSDAQDIINSWIESPTLLNDCAEILSREGNQRIRFSVGSLLKNYIPLNWSRYSVDSHIFIRNVLQEQIKLNPPEEKKETCENIADAVAKIAVYDVLGEWDTFIEENTFDESSSYEHARGCLIIWDAFCKQVDESKNITNDHKFKLRQMVCEGMPTIKELVALGFQDISIASFALGFLSSLLKWAPLPDIVDMDLVNIICQNFLAEVETISPSIDCLTTIFVKRSDCISSFRDYAASVVCALALSTDPENPQMQITTRKDVIQFLTRFLSRFLSLIETLFVQAEPSQEPDLYTIEIINSAEALLSMLPSYGITREEFHEYLLSLYRIVLSVESANIDPMFWKLWNDIARKMYFEKIQQRGGPHPIWEFFEPILPMIRECLYERLPLAVDDSGVCTFDARSCWSMLVDVDGDLIDFLLQQSPSPSLCYSFGCLEFASEREGTRELFGQVVGLIDEVDASDSEMEDLIIGLLFGSTHCTRMLMGDRETFIKVVEFIIGCFSNGGRIATAASHALYYVVQRMINDLIANQMELAQQVIEASSEYLTQLEYADAARLYKLCIQLIAKCDDPDTVANAITELFTPVYEQLEEFYASPDDENNMKGARDALDIISNSVSDMSEAHAATIVEQLAPPLLDLREHVIGVPQYEEIALSLVQALANLMVTAPFEVVQDEFQETLNQLTNGNNFETACRFVAVVRAKKKEVTNYIEPIINEFVEPALESESPPLEPILVMLGEFELNDFDHEWFLNVFCMGVESFSCDLNIAAFNSFRSLMSKASGDAQKRAFLEMKERAIGVTFTALTDMLHGGSFEDMVEFLRYIMQLANDLKLFDQEMVDFIAGVLRDCCEEPQEGFFDEVAAYMRTSIHSPRKFARCINEFLVALRKLSPVDIDMFKIDEDERFGAGSGPLVTSFRTKLDTIKKDIRDEDGVVRPSIISLTVRKRPRNI